MDAGGSAPRGGGSGLSRTLEYSGRVGLDPIERQRLAQLQLEALIQERDDLRSRLAVTEQRLLEAGRQIKLLEESRSRAWTFVAWGAGRRKPKARPKVSAVRTASTQRSRSGG